MRMNFTHAANHAVAGWLRAAPLGERAARCCTDHGRVGGGHRRKPRRRRRRLLLHTSLLGRVRRARRRVVRAGGVGCAARAAPSALRPHRDGPPPEPSRALLPRTAAETAGSWQVLAQIIFGAGTVLVGGDMQRHPIDPVIFALVREAMAGLALGSAAAVTPPPRPSSPRAAGAAAEQLCPE